MNEVFSKILENMTVEASAPCRVDMGGTLDIRTFYLPLRRYRPCTVNLAIALRTRVRLMAFDAGKIHIESTGFESATFPAHAMPFDHPLGLVCAITAYWGASGIKIQIDSPSPPKSALGGSSAAAVALMAAFCSLAEKDKEKPFSRREIVSLAHAVEESVAAVPCGLQDQVAAAYGGVNLWSWQDGVRMPSFQRVSLIPRRSVDRFSTNLLIAYCGIPHESSNINRIWVQQFINGLFRKEWAEMAGLTREFASAISANDLHTAIAIMNQETGLRQKMTPEVLDQTGRLLVNAAVEENCGARFTGAGGGGCIWAIGETGHINRLNNRWQNILTPIKGAYLLPTTIDTQGLLCSAKLNRPG
ncbi:MAG: galactokinase [Desulfatirhabdiaceae bacterium]